MKRNIFRQIARALIIGFALMLFVRSDHTWAQAKQPQLRQSVELKFEERQLGQGWTRGGDPVIHRK